jgi:EamA domain-containing membrane protein RarD
VVVWHEPMSARQLTSFLCIWVGMAVFSVGLWRRFRPARHGGTMSGT